MLIVDNKVINSPIKNIFENLLEQSNKKHLIEDKILDADWTDNLPEIVENELKIKGIPTILYDDKKHTGLWKAE